MLQVIVRKGKIAAEQIPAPSVSEGNVLIKVINSCVSIGTEIKTLESSGKSSIRKSIDSPEKIRKFFLKLRENGFSAVYSKVKQLKKRDKFRNEAGSALGYSISGVVVAVGDGVSNFHPGDQVAAAGAGKANHAEFVVVPKNLVVKKPVDISFEDASTVAIGSIALQGIRRAKIQVGEYCVVFGIGIIGLITLQILRNIGIKVIAIDIYDERLEVANEYGAELTINPNTEDPVDKVISYTGDYGADVVIFTASTSDSEPLSNALKMIRRKGRLVLLGVAGDRIKREDIYYNEIDFLISTSYGPGRYDELYEEKGYDYPYGYVRWTENRNMAEYLRLISCKTVSFSEIKKSIYFISKIENAFNDLKNKQSKLNLVIVEFGTGEFTLKKEELKSSQKFSILTTKNVKNEKIKTAIAGIGGFALSTHLPNLSKLQDKYQLHAVMNKTGQKAKYVSDKYNAKYVTTNYEDLLNDDEIDLIMICTNHATHADMALNALNAGKNVFLEKPLAINDEELKRYKEFYSNGSIKSKPILMVGFNRRFSPYIRDIKKFTDKRINPLFMHYRINAGRPPLTHWLYCEGGRIIGEVCHIIDLAGCIIESEVQAVYCDSITPKNEYYLQDDNKVINLKYEDGSLCIIEYFAMGNKELPKEYMEIHFDGKSIILDDYKSLKGYGISLKEIKTSKSEKGLKEELIALYNSLKENNSKWPISLKSMFETTEITFQTAN